MVGPDEEARHARQAEVLGQMQAAKSAKHGKGRLLHHKAMLSARGSVFAKQGSYDAIVRRSNGDPDVQSNRKPDIRVFALKILGQQGESALGCDTDHQDFLMINHESFASPNSSEFVAFLQAASGGPLRLIGTLIRLHGFGGAFALLKRFAGVVGKPFSGFASEAFNTCLPVSVGPYAARVLLLPVAATSSRDPDPEKDMHLRLAAGPVEYELALQFFVGEAITPIEDPTVVWPQTESPPVVVARLRLDAEASGVEEMRFYPWSGLAQHRPLGEIMRARKHAYYISQKGSGAA
ncbi:MAG: catalase [Candidatus Protistobacter heckmanni]|nr:catalase [Candidatus Protistobacter heckmanni]